MEQRVKANAKPLKVMAISACCHEHVIIEFVALDEQMPKHYAIKVYNYMMAGVDLQVGDLVDFELIIKERVQIQN